MLLLYKAHILIYIVVLEFLVLNQSKDEHQNLLNSLNFMNP